MRADYLAPPIRLVVSDIDGTLVRSDKSLSPRVIDAVGRLRATGVAVSLISARPPSGMLKIIERLDLPGIFGAFNGGTLIHADGQVASSSQVSPIHSRDILRELEEAGVERWVFANGQWFATTATSAHLSEERKATSAEPIIRKSFDDLLDRIDKIVGVSDDHKLLRSLEETLCGSVGAGATIARSQDYYLDVTSSLANKGDGLVALAKAYGVPLSQTLVIGDQRNDLPMFARAAVSIAMGQAPDAVRNAATHLTLSNDEDGLADAIDRVIIPPSKTIAASGS